MAEQFQARPIRFWEEYRHQGDGSVKTIEYVELARPGMANISALVLRISDKVKSGDDWSVIQPYYEAWRKGSQAPESGTPLGSWPGLTREQAEVFRTVGLRSVEEIAAMPEKVMNMVRLPEVQRFKNEAKIFLEAKNVRGSELKMQAMQAQIEELKAMVASKSRSSGGDDDEYDDDTVTERAPAPKVRKRRTKAEMAAAALENTEAG